MPERLLEQANSHDPAGVGAELLIPHRTVTAAVILIMVFNGGLCTVGGQGGFKRGYVY